MRLRSTTLRNSLCDDCESLYMYMQRVSVSEICHASDSVPLQEVR